MKVIKANLKAKMGHLCRHDSNTTELTYHFPHRPGITGMLGAVMGFDFNQYRKNFNVGQCRIGVGVRCNPRTIYQRVNYSHLKGAEKRMNNYIQGLKKKSPFLQSRPTVLGILLPGKGEKNLSYDIYVFLEDEGLQKELYSRVHNGRYSYPVYLGSMGFPAWFNDCQLLNIDTINDKSEYIDSVYPESLGLVDYTETKGIVYKETSMSLFTGADRYTTNHANYEFSPARVFGEFTGRVFVLDDGEQIISLEEGA